jgi:mitogen-activated protein kinase kinase kinase
MSNGSSALPSSGSPRSIRSVATGSGSVISSLSTAGVPAPTDDELAGRTFLEWLKAWDDAQVARWLNDIRCGSHVSTFASNDIRGNVLLDVDQQALKEMGVQSVRGGGGSMRSAFSPRGNREANANAAAADADATRSEIGSRSLSP